MTPELDSRPDDLAAQVEQILEAVDDQIALLDDDESREEAFGELRGLGGRADELVEATDPKSLLVAVDSSDDPPDPQEDSLATVMSKSDPESIAKLRTILTLSKLPDVNDGTLTERVEQIRNLRSLSGATSAVSEPSETTEGQAETTDTGGESTEDDSPSKEEEEADVSPSKGEEEEPPSGAESGADGEAGEAEAEDADASADAAESNAETDADTDAESDTEPSKQLKERLQEGIDDFRDGIDSYRDSLTDEAKADTESDDADSDNDTDESESTMGRQSQESGTRRGAGTMFSTMPSRNRTGMRGTSRFSTVPRNRRSKNE